MQISLKEMRESNYWLRIIKYTQDFETTKLKELEWLLKESEELKKILGSIVVKSKAKIE